jgi:hypothetical protein
MEYSYYSETKSVDPVKKAGEKTVSEYESYEEEIEEEMSDINKK